MQHQDMMDAAKVGYQCLDCEIKQGIQYSQYAGLLEADFWWLYIAAFTVCPSLSKGILYFFLLFHQVLILDIICCISTKLSLLLLDSEDTVAFS